jgi:hypothetical protein
MFTALLIPVLLSCPLADGEPRRSALEGAPPSFELAIRGTLGSSINLRCTITPGKQFSVRRTLPKGMKAEVRGEVRTDKDGTYVLDVSIPERESDGQAHPVKFSTRLKLGEKGMIYLGWVRWYEVTLSRGK